MTKNPKQENGLKRLSMSIIEFIFMAVLPITITLIVWLIATLFEKFDDIINK